MKKLSNINFADSSYLSLEMLNDNLVIYFESWDNKIIKTVFSQVLFFKYQIGSIISVLYEETTESEILKQSVALYYVAIPLEHPFKAFSVLDIDDAKVFEIVASNVTVTKEQKLIKMKYEGKHYQVL